MGITITEALAEIKTIGKRLEKKREFVFANLGRQDGLRDALEKDGGSVEVLKRERQAIGDLQNRIVALRRAIHRANDETTLTVGEAEMTITEWLTWRREVAPGHKAFLAKIASGVRQIRESAKRSGVNTVPPGGSATTPQDFVMHLDEGGLAKETEDIEQVLGQLDGLLSLKNATTMVE